MHVCLDEGVIDKDPKEWWEGACARESGEEQ